ncbi:MAG: class I SAM-dependent methyltransferase [Saprospiraceae bacterium]|nr:MAG: class I SAM-dependent methyltransferase [Saprospiraceae bacterium]
MENRMMTQALYHEGMEYAEQNFLSEDASHLKVDKQLLRNRFNLDQKLVLDFGCGMGGMSLWYAKTWKCRVHGVDIDRHHIRIANDLKRRHSVENVTFEVRNILDNPLTEKYDFIVLNDVAEHIPLPLLKQMLAAMSMALATRGQVFISYPPWGSPYASHVSHVVGIPWCQFLPQAWLMKLIAKNNRPIVGDEEGDLIAAYKGLNHLTHAKLMAAVEGSGLQCVYRKSHSFLNWLPLMHDLNLRMPLLDYLVTKEFVLLKKQP